MTYLTERLSELRRHVEHLRALRPRVESGETLRQDLSLHNDVLYSLIFVCQLVIDVAGELGARRGLRYENYTDAIRNLSAYDEIPEALVAKLIPLPSFRNIALHEYVDLDLDKAVEAMDRLDAVEELVRRVSGLLLEEES